MLANGVIPRPIPTSTVAFCPPLVIGDDDLDLIVAATRSALAELAGTQA
jgi:putrescine aminotransferase